MKRVHSFILAVLIAFGLVSLTGCADSAKPKEYPGSEMKELAFHVTDSEGIKREKTATSPAIDLSSLSLEDLLQLHNDVRTEINNRLYLQDNTLIGRADYLVGRDIKPGTYLFTVVDSDKGKSGDIWNQIIIYDSDGEVFYVENFSQVGSTKVFALSDGQELSIAGCTGYLSECSPDWAP